MSMKNIKDSIFYVGVNDRTTHIFERLWSLRRGVSYNSYVVVDEKVAVIDTVEASSAGTFFGNIAEATGGRPVDYLIVRTYSRRHEDVFHIRESAQPAQQIELRTMVRLKRCTASREQAVALRARPLRLLARTLEAVHVRRRPSHVSHRSAELRMLGEPPHLRHYGIRAAAHHAPPLMHRYRAEPAVAVAASVRRHGEAHRVERAYRALRADGGRRVQHVRNVVHRVELVRLKRRRGRIVHEPAQVHALHKRLGGDGILVRGEEPVRL